MSDMQEVPDTEITLGTGRMLGLFFGLAVVCAVFFGLGFALGRNTTTPATAQAAASPTTETGTLQPAAARTASGTPACAGAAGCDPHKDSGRHELAFLQPEPKDAATPPPATVAEEPAPAPSVPHTTMPARLPRQNKPAAVQSGFVAQVAAVRRREDAETLVSALRRRKYPVFIAAESPDRLFHVQVGPFADRKDAQAMKDKLSGDGYNSLVK